MATVERTIGDLTVCIDRDGCISSGNCVKVAPALFQLDSESIVAFAPAAESVERERILDACQVCPVEALAVKDASGRRLVP
jgi:ferredoxin